MSYHRLEVPDVLRCLLLTTAVTLCAAVPSLTLAKDEIYTDTPPPVPRVEIAPPPRDGYAWDAGHWEWNGHAYTWISGHWIGERRAAHRVAGRWEQDGTRWHFIEGHWERSS